MEEQDVHRMITMNADGVLRDLGDNIGMHQGCPVETPQKRG